MAGRTPSRPIIVFCRLNTSDLGLWLLRQAMTEAKDIELLYDLWEQNVDTLRTLKARSAALIQLKPLPKNRFITCLIHQRHRQNRARRDCTRDLNSYG